MARAKLDLEAIIDSAPLCGFQVAVIASCALLAMLDGFDTQTVAFVAPEIAIDWNIEPARFAPVFGAGVFGGLLGAMIFGRAGDRFGRRPVLLLSVPLFAAGSCVTPLVGSLAYLGGARFLTGLGLGGTLPTAIALTSEYSPRRLRATLVTTMFCGFPLGAVAGGLASAKLIPAFGWQSVFIAGGVIPALLLPSMVAFLPESVRFLAARGASSSVAQILERMHRRRRWNGELVWPPDRPARATVAMLFSPGRAVGTSLLWMTFFLSLLVTYLLINWIPLIARQQGLDTGTAIMAVSMLNLGSIVGATSMGRLADRWGRTSVVAWGYALGALFIALLGFLRGTPARLGALTFVAGLCSIGAQMCTVALCSGFYDTAARATGVGWSIGVGRTGAIAGPMLGGALLGAGVSSQVLFLVVGAGSLGAAVAVFMLGRFVPSGQPDAPERLFASAPHS